MISFVIIGKNEGVKIKNAIQSVFVAIKDSRLSRYEVIYVDSDSTDKSIEFASEFDRVTVISLKGQVNAAVARNEGANHAIGDILFFIDGDMEITSTFLTLVLKEDGNLTYPFISGDFVSIDDNYHGERKEVYYHNLKNDTYQNTTGGIFLIERSLWLRAGGMKPKMRRSQDIDLGLRLTKLGFPLLRKKEVIAKHYTTFYDSDKRIWKDLKKGNQIYQRSVIYRDHIFNKAAYKYILREVSLGLLIAQSVLVLFGFHIVLLSLYPIALVAKLMAKQKLKSLKMFFKFFAFYALLDLMILYGLIFFWPTNKKVYRVQLI